MRYGSANSITPSVQCSELVAGTTIGRFALFTSGVGAATDHPLNLFVRVSGGVAVMVPGVPLCDKRLQGIPLGSLGGSPVSPRVSASDCDESAARVSRSGTPRRTLNVRPIQSMPHAACL